MAINTVVMSTDSYTTRRDSPLAGRDWWSGCVVLMPDSRPAVVRRRALRCPTRDMKRILVQPTVFGARLVTTRAIQSAMSADTWVNRPACSSPSASKNTFNAASLRPGPAHTRGPVS